MSRCELYRTLYSTHLAAEAEPRNGANDENQSNDEAGADAA